MDCMASPKDLFVYPTVIKLVHVRQLAARIVTIYRNLNIPLHASVLGHAFKFIMV